MKRALLFAFVVGALATTAPVARPHTVHAHQTDAGAPPLPSSAERAYREVSARFDAAAAFPIVEFMQQYWRIAGNPGFNASIDRIRDLLVRDGFVLAGSQTTSPGSAGDGAVVRVEETASPVRGWDYRTGTVAFADGGEPLLSRERDRVSLAINSFPTSADGLVTRLVDVGNGDKFPDDVRGAVVLGDAALARLWTEAVKKRGAAGVISAEIAPYIRPSDPAALTDAQKDVLQWGTIPYDDAAKSFAFKASWRVASRMRERLRSGPAKVRVRIDASFYSGPNRTVVAEIPGRSRPGERVVIVAHVQEPGANDNASGCATLYGLARALLAAIRAGALPRPERTLTFMWVDEIRGSRDWIAGHPTEARNVQYMFSMDMTGENTSITGGTFRIEKQADPSAVWTRPSDPHSEWGASEVKVETLKGSLLNDLHLAVCRRRARDTGWVVTTNPYEGGSDHTVFGEAGVPSLLNWHFTDRFYHTNQDTAEKVSGDEMKNVGVAVAASAWVLASADERDADAVLTIVETAARARFELERTQGATLVAAAPDRAAAEATERQVIDAWRKWYAEAFDSVLRLPVSGASANLRARVDNAKTSVLR
jgi:hypothetical protein